MRVSPTAGLCASVFAFMLGLFSTILPYWTSVELDGVVYHGGLWRNCTVYTTRFDCRNVKHVKEWFHVVQYLMAIGVLVQFLTMISGCIFHYGEYGRRVCVTFALSSLTGGLVIVSAVIVYGVENKVHAAIFSAGFYIAIMSAVLSLLSAVLGLLAGSKSRNGYITFRQ
ncbi:uncharacterized protein LOC123534090 [Mercenaria mercenaria]|uniref:uncharacterized protein LOC123534090 n=1 Tax=Mercenaria mercenaria TaxID=6596 RepID=UPI00234F9BCE|nr:uncharacterized protein LOC123534090 [Mercenaria mercenaria]